MRVERKLTTCLADETRELARVRTGTIKRMRVDAVTACQNLESALAELSARTGISMTTGDPHLCGHCGETVPLVKDWLRESISDRVGRRAADFLETLK